MTDNIPPTVPGKSPSISDLKLDDTSIERLAIFYRNFITTPMAICFTNERGNIVEANRSFLNLYGYTIDEVRGQNPRILKSGRQSPAVYKSLWESISNREIGSWTGELINRTKSGDEIYVLLTISSVFRPDGSLIGYVASTLDISQRKKIELELEERNSELEQLNKFKSDMMAITSHDLKAPLNAMISYADLLKESIDTLPVKKQTEYLEKISDYGRQLTTFIGELLDLTKIEAGKFQIMTARARLDAVLQGCIEINQAHSMSKGIRINFYREGKNRTAVVDVLRMAQVFNNTLSNAVKFSPEGGDIAVKYKDDGSGMLKIIIEDQGPGIPEEDLKRIFDQYYQVSKGGYVPQRAFGAGIGLSVVRGIVELHGGMVTAENLPEKTGCRFTITMPLKTFTSIKGMGVMIFDPGETIFGYVEPPVRQKGCDCFTVRNAREAWRVFEFENPDVIFANGDAMNEEHERLLRRIVEADPESYLVGICTSEAAAEIFHQILSAPVADIEINDILDNVLFTKQKR